MRGWVIVSVVGLLGFGCGKAKPASKPGTTGSSGSHSSSSSSSGTHSSSSSGSTSSGTTSSTTASSSSSGTSGGVSSGSTSSTSSTASTSSASSGSTSGSTTSSSASGSTGATASSGSAGTTSGSAGSTGTSSSSGGTSGSASSSGGTTGTVCSNDPGCTVAGDTACDPAGSNQVGTCTLGGDGCLHVTGLAACSTANQVCTPGQAACSCNPTPACSSGQTQCNATNTGTQTCGTDTAGCAAWVPAQSCTSHQTCSATAPGGPGCVCADACASAGANPDVQCGATSSAYQVCSLDVNGCRYWAGNTCPGAEVCSSTLATAGTNPPCTCPSTAVCNPGDQRCNPTSGNPELCITGAGGCPTWSQLATCNAPYQQCQVSGGSASCQCVAAPGCTGATLGQTFCPTAGGATYQTCAVDGASGCFYFTAVQSCPSSQQTCVASAGNGSQGSCTCPASACNPANPPTCSGSTDLQSCQLDAPNGCGVPTTTSCPTQFGAGSTCSTSGGTAHCTCPAPTGSTLMVDATAGSDTSGTGAASPPACAFKSITKALATTGVGTTFTTVSARTGTYNAANGETFPIQLPAGVTLTTDATPSATATYTISGSGTFALPPRGTVSASVVFTGTGSAVLQNFTVVGVTGAGNPSYAFACNAGTPTVNGATLSSADNGAGAFGSCSPTLSGVTTKGNGVSGTTVATSGTATLNGQVSDSDANGLRARNGTTTVNVMEVKNAGAEGVLLNPSNFFGVTTAVTFGATGLEVHDGASDGIRVRAGSGTAYPSITVSSSSFHKNRGAGINLEAGSPTFSTVQTFDNDNEGLICDVDLSSNGHTATFSNTTVATNCQAGACRGVLLNSGTLNLSGTSAAPTSINSNDGSGIEMAGGTFNGQGLIVSANTQDGVSVDAPNGGFTCLGCTVASNLGNGYLVHQAPAPGGGAVGFKLAPIPGSASGGSVTSNGRSNAATHGIQLQGDTGQIDASLTSVVAGSNTHGAGLVVGDLGGGGGSPVNAELLSCELTGNGFSTNLGGRTLSAGGAVVVDTGGSLNLQGTAVHGNLYNGISVLPSFAGPGTVSLDGNACTGAGATPNQFYCYGTGNVGVVAYDGVQVSAANELWNQATPAAGVDFAGATLFTNTAGTVDAATPCGAASNACP